MVYAFILGRVYTLCLAEIIETIKRLGLEVTVVDVAPDCFIVESAASLPVETLQKALGGAVKIGRIIDVVKKRPQDSVNFALKHYFKPSKLKTDFLKNKNGKLQFGVSIYPMSPEVMIEGESRRLGMMVKRGMQDSGASIRLVFPEFNSNSLSSVLVTHNHLLEKGVEILVCASNEALYVGKTVTVQDFEDYGRRDYQRPVRDDRVGMIPPKVAQCLVNLLGLKPGSTILDPFCGSGTIVQEGILLEYKMVGSDFSSLAISGSQKNLEWFRNRYKIAPGKYHVEVIDAKHVSSLVEKLQGVKAVKEISGIATEGTLGPTYTEFPTEKEIQANFEELSALYKESFTDFAKFLPAKAKIAICFPAYKKGPGKYVYMPEEQLDQILKSGYNIKALIPASIAGKFKFLKLTSRGSAIYDRKDQVVAREVIVFEKS